MDASPANPPGGTDPANPPGALFLNARNGFNELGLCAILLTILHRWAAGFRSAFNCYRHAAQLILRRKDWQGYTLLSSEGVTQGNPLSMILYGLTLVPLAKTLQRAHPEVVQAWYANDRLLKGRTLQVAAAMTLLQCLGPERGYFPEPAKSIPGPRIRCPRSPSGTRKLPMLN
jgi:hypothetical protein